MQILGVFLKELSGGQVKLDYPFMGWILLWVTCFLSSGLWAHADEEHSVLDRNLLARLGEFDVLLVKSSVFTRGQLCVTVRLWLC